MTYDPLLPRVIPIFVYYIFVSIFGVYVTIRMFLKWKERKVKPPLYLALVFLFLSINNCWRISRDLSDLASYRLFLGYSC